MKKTNRYQSVRLTTLAISTILFPITFFYLSPEVSLKAAFFGIVSGAVMVFLSLAVIAMFVGRSFCSWLCPAGGIQDQVAQVRTQTIALKRLSWIKYVVWSAWGLTLLFLMFKANGIQSFDFFYDTEQGVSASSLPALIAYACVVLTFLLLGLSGGRRFACHTICWISPFMIIGRVLGRWLKLPHLHFKTDATRCVSCGTCTKNCPMSLPVLTLVQQGQIDDDNCILCGRCENHCKRGAIELIFKQ